MDDVSLTSQPDKLRGDATTRYHKDENHVPVPRSGRELVVQRVNGRIFEDIAARRCKRYDAWSTAQNNKERSGEYIRLVILRVPCVLEKTKMTSINNKSIHFLL